MFLFIHGLFNLQTKIPESLEMRDYALGVTEYQISSFNSKFEFPSGTLQIFLFLMYSAFAKL